jgi:hypothetical protein
VDEEVCGAVEMLGVGRGVLALRNWGRGKMEDGDWGWMGGRAIGGRWVRSRAYDLELGSLRGG